MSAHIDALQQKWRKTTTRKVQTFESLNMQLTQEAFHIVQTKIKCEISCFGNLYSANPNVKS